MNQSNEEKEERILMQSSGQAETKRERKLESFWTVFREDFGIPIHSPSLVLRSDPWAILLLLFLSVSLRFLLFNSLLFV